MSKQSMFGTQYMTSSRLGKATNSLHSSIDGRSRWVSVGAQQRAPVYREGTGRSRRKSRGSIPHAQNALHRGMEITGIFKLCKGTAIHTTESDTEYVMLGYRQDPQPESSRVWPYVSLSWFGMLSLAGLLRRSCCQTEPIANIMAWKRWKRGLVCINKLSPGDKAN